MKRWLRVVLPQGEYVALFFLLYSGILAVSWWTLSLWPSELDGPSKVFLARDGLVILGAIAYGTFRVVAFHPVCREKYLKFLKQTAWTPEKPLPVGQVHLIWQDAVIMLVLVAMVWHAPFIHPLWVFHFGMIGYLLGLSYAFLQCRVWSYMYALLFGLGGAFLFWSNPLVVTAIILALYGVGFQGMKQSLNVLYHSAEEDLLQWAPLNAQSKNRGALLKKLDRLSGWPFDVLAPKTPSINLMKAEVAGLPAFHGVLISLLAGWWMFSITVPAMEISESPNDNWADQFVEQVGSQTELTPKVAETIRQELLTAEKSAASKNFSKGFLFIFMYGGLALICCRLSIYCKGHHSPINLWGRLWTFRWIIPEYDKVLISPLCTLLAMFGVYPPLVFFLGVSPLFAGPFTITLMFLATLNLGPRRVDWLLTSPCKIAPSGEYKSKQLGVFEDV